MEHEEIADISVGSGIISAFGRIDERTDQLFREFIDNSTSSYQDHETVLNKIQDCCKVKITWNNDEIIIQDNAYGMNEEEFRRALKLNAKASQYSDTSRSKYGLGLKYAAANLGNWYKIETIEYKSCQKFEAVIDIEDLETNNPEQLKWTRSDVSDDYHGTKITIKKLNKKLSSNTRIKNKTTKFDELIQNLSMIYSKDLKDHRLELSINDTVVQYKRPEIWENENGNQYYCTIKENSFKHDGKIYRYTGWAAIRRIADTSGAGFALMQKDRAIDLHYLPEDLFGRHNDFRYQRVFGEINLLGDSWTVTFTKNAVKWENNGLEESFISALLNNDDLRYILATAKKLRKDPPDSNKLLGTTQTIKTNTDNTTNTVSSNSTQKTNVQTEVKTESTKNTNVSNKPVGSTQTNYNSGKNDSSTMTTGHSNRSRHEYTYNNTKYIFNIDTNSNTDPKGDWLKVALINEETNEFNLDINFRTTFLKGFKQENTLSAILQMAIVFVVAQFESVKVGLSLNSSKYLIDKINEILKTENPFK